MGRKYLTDVGLRNRGYRITEGRNKIMEIFSPANARAYTCKEITKKTALDQSTVFRILEMLKKEKFLHKSPLMNRYYLCGVEDEQVCHQAVICETCGKFEENPLYEHAHPKLKKFSIRPQNHELLATCNLCK